MDIIGKVKLVAAKRQANPTSSLYVIVGEYWEEEWMRHGRVWEMQMTRGLESED